MVPARCRDFRSKEQTPNSFSLFPAQTYDTPKQNVVPLTTGAGYINPYYNNLGGYNGLYGLGYPYHNQGLYNAYGAYGAGPYHANPYLANYGYSGVPYAAAAYAGAPQAAAAYAGAPYAG